VSDGEIVYVSTERERGSELRRLSTRGERPRGSTGQFLTTAAAAMAASHGRERDGEVIDSYDYLETPRQALFLEDRDGGDGSGGPRTRSRSITYATTGARLSRERVLVEEGGRRRETYQVIGR
jgi:hypothetical protein